MSELRKSSDRCASRRDFLKASAVAGALAGGLSVARSAHAAGSDVLKIGLIGCGGRGSGAAANALTADPNTKLVAMGDAFADRIETSVANLTKQFGERVDVPAERRFAGFDAYQKVLDSGIDVVCLAETPHFRPKHLKAAVDAGKHIFCEKPVAVDAPGIRSILATSEEAKKKGLNIVSGLCWRYHTAVQETMNRILDGAIGDIIAMQELYLCAHAGFRERDPSWSEMEYQIRNWYYFTWLSGDHNVEQHVHSLDKALWAMHDQPPLQAFGMGGRQVRTDASKYGDIFDHHAVCYEWPNGVRAYSYTRQQGGCFNETSDIFLGTKGRANILKNVIEGPNAWKYESKVKCNMYVAEHEALFKAIRAGTPINNGQYMAYSTMLAILGRMVNYTGKQITWEQAINSQQTLAPAAYAWDAEPPTKPDANGNYPVAMPGVTPLV